MNKNALILLSENGDIVGAFAADSINLTDNITNAIKQYLGEGQITELLLPPNYSDLWEHNFEVCTTDSNGQDLIYEFSLIKTTVQL